MFFHFQDDSDNDCNKQISLSDAITVSPSFKQDEKKNDENPGSTEKCQVCGQDIESRACVCFQSLDIAYVAASASPSTGIIVFDTKKVNIITGLATRALVAVDDSNEDAVYVCYSI